MSGEDGVNGTIGWGYKGFVVNLLE